MCAATEAGFIEYANLPGTIKAGCQLFPLRHSKYCFPRVGTMSDPEESHSSVMKQDGVIKYLVAKKNTRNATYYQVLT